MKKLSLKHWCKLLLIILVFTAGIGLSDFAHANNSLSGGGLGLAIEGTGDVQISGDIVQDRTLGETVIDMVNFFIGFLGIIATIMFVYAGVLWVTAGGNDESIGKSKKIMTYAALGLVVVILSYSIVQFITSSAGGSQGDVECGRRGMPACADGYYCSSEGTCKLGEGGGFGSFCDTDFACSYGFSCTGGRCTPVNDNACLVTTDCNPGDYCSEAGICQTGNNITCTSNDDCEAPKQCDPFGLCRNQTAGTGATCEDNSDCPTSYVCNEDKNKCELEGSGNTGGPGTDDGLTDLDGDGDIDEDDQAIADAQVTGGDSQALADEALAELDESLNVLGETLGNIADEINDLPETDQDNIAEALEGGLLSDKISNVQALLDSSTDPEVIKVLEKLMRGLEQLRITRDQLDTFRTVMPESEETIAKWDETSESLDELIDDPLSSIKLRRYEKLYRELRELVRKFPVVLSRIIAAPGSGNVPFTVTFDGLSSVDPTGGTISDYKWSFLDSSGNLVSLGNSPVVVHEFTEPNTYSVRLQVSTNNKDDSGYKKAMDGISTVRVKANPPTSQVAFRINGIDVKDVHHVTLEEAKAGISFDPSITIPALGRTINEYEWFYGDTKDEIRTVPATVVHSYSKPGEYFVTLKVTDSQGITDKRVIKLIVKSLAADIEFIPREGNVNTEFRFRGINSRSDDGNIRSYEWQILDPNGQVVVSSDEENFYHTFESPGKYNVELLVTDTTGSSDKSIRELNVYSRKPIASFDYSIPEINHPNTVEFSAITSYDPDQGDQITYSWDFDGDGQFEFVDSKDILVTYTYRRKGDFKVILQVQDSFGQRNQIEKNISINSILSADILIDKKAAQVGEEITFTADSDTAVAYLWEFGDGETSSTEDDTVTHTYLKAGKYKVKLNYFDRDDNDASAQSFVLVGAGDGPVAAASALVDGRNQIIHEDICGEGVDGYMVIRSDNVVLSGRGSVNRDGSSRLLTYDWKFDNGTRNSDKEFTHRFNDVNKPGECSFVSLVVRDDISGKVSAEDVLYFKVINEIPDIIDFVVEGDLTTKELVTPTKVRLKVVGPRDGDGQIKKYKWWYYREGFSDEKLGVHSTSSPETEMIITAQGQPDVKNRYYFAVEITDNDNGVFESLERFGEVSYLEVTNGPNLSPVAEFTVDKTTISVGDSITFISQSYDPQGDELPSSAFQWDFDGDGAFDDTTSGAQVSRQFNTPGEYEIRLKVINRGLSSSATRTVYVEPTNSFPQAAFIYTVNGNTVNFNGDVSRYDPDLDDTTLRFEWDFDITQDQNGNSVNDDDVESTAVNPSFTYSAPGTYRVRLLVKDSLGQEGVVVRDVNLDLSAQDRERNTCRTLGVDAPGQPITTLSTSVSPCQISRGGTADIIITVLNANSTPYYGTVFFEILEGSGEFTPNPVQAKDGKAQVIFTGTESGSVRIRVKATDTYYGDVTEEININVN